jgi:fructose-1,6-bisphosphatase I
LACKPCQHRRNESCPGGTGAPTQGTESLTETLDDYLRAFADGDATCDAVAAVVGRIAEAAVQLADLAAKGPLAGSMAAVLGRNAGGDEQKALDLLAHELFLDALKDAPVAALASEEADEPIEIDRSARLVVAIDPLDGSKNIDVNAAIGSIFAILPTHDLPWTRLFLQPGSALLGAGFTVHGPQTALVLALGTGVNIFALDRARGAFVLSQANVRLPAGVREYAINAANYRHWDGAIRAYVDDCVAGADGPRGGDFNMRWLGCAVAEAYRVLLRGGVYLYPGDARPGMQHGRLRLVYEANPLAFIVEQAGGAATDGIGRVLDIVPTFLHQHTPLVYGARDKVDRVAAYCSGTLPQGGRSPLFARRGLFRV